MLAAATPTVTFSDSVTSGLGHQRSYQLVHAVFVEVLEEEWLLHGGRCASLYEVVCGKHTHAHMIHAPTSTMHACTHMHTTHTKKGFPLHPSDCYFILPDYFIRVSRSKLWFRTMLLLCEKLLLNYNSFMTYYRFWKP